MINIDLKSRIETDLQPDSDWIAYEYTFTSYPKTIESWKIIPNTANTHEISKIIWDHLHSHIDIVDIVTLSPQLQQLIINCHQSDNEMWFEEDEETLSELDLNSLEKEVEENNLDKYILFGYDDVPITIFGGISEVINFANFENY